MLFQAGSASATRRFRALFVLAALIVTPLLASTATAQEKKQVRKKFKDKIHVLQPKPVLQKGRFELAPRLGVTINDTIHRDFKLGVNANFHIAESFYVGGIFEWYDFGDALGGPTGSYRDVRNQTLTDVDAPVLNWLAGAEVGFVPLWGKFALFNNFIIFYDISVSAGGAFINASSIRLPGAQGTGGGTLALNNRIFLSKWLALNVEVRDMLFLVDLDGQPGAFSNVASVSLGVSFYLPTSFEYSEKVVDVPSS